jgi:UDP-N-acetylmuramoyl-tripeptide--D-alanyl-D-alanine ligase
MSVVLEILAVFSLLAGYRAQALRWLRVAQREHYLPGSVQQFRVRWGISRPINVAAELASLVLLIASFVLRPHHESLAVVALMLVGGVAVVEPQGLSIRGRTSALAMTKRLQRVLWVTTGVGALIVLIAGLTVDLSFGLALAVISVAGVIDLALRLLQPLERKSMQRFVDQAAKLLGDVKPTVVAITGSYGKTSTKLHLTQLIAGERAVVATPASFNNRGGLARSINEHLSFGTEVFVAEMGTYGPGEIADLCAWIPPDISVMTAIGPVHLERFGSLEVTLRSKAEITVQAKTVVLNVDDPLLASLVDHLKAQGKTVVRCSTTRRDVEITVEVANTGEATLFESGQPCGSLGQLAPGVQPINVALAIGAARALGVEAPALVERAPLLAAAANRSTVAVAASGVTVIDDTFNANPAGAKAALATLRGLEAGRRIVVTPGMIELGPLQQEANAEFAREAGQSADLVIVVGRTNRKALLQGLRDTSCEVQCVETRDEAVALVKSTVNARDAVLYENDLPDHYP